jgi:hypothetical protein
MDHGINAMLCKDLSQRFAIEQIDLVEGQGFTRDLLHPVQSFFFAVVEIINHDNLVTGIQQFDACVATNIACASRDEYVHMISSRFFVFDDVRFIASFLLSRASNALFYQRPTAGWRIAIFAIDR